MTVPRVYVSSARGSDETGDGTKDKPFRTIAKAFAALPTVGGQEQGVGFIDVGGGYVMGPDEEILP